GIFSKPLKLAVGEKETPVSLTARGASSYSVLVGGETVDLDIVARETGKVRFAVGGVQTSAVCAFDGATLHIETGGEQLTTRETSHEIKSAAEREGGARLVAPMNGRIVSVLAQAGEAVKKGQRIVILEAMKMQHEITAGRDGVLETVSVKEGDQVATRHVLATLAAEDD
ncbi:MAG: hypothetical protein KDJ40_18865, partial [Hyphomicrobiales bacterium]|nr:hypothetical protein [Hyphomicrobiales bacterium]